MNPSVHMNRLAIITALALLATASLPLVFAGNVSSNPTVVVGQPRLCIIGFNKNFTEAGVKNLSYKVTRAESGQLCSESLPQVDGATFNISLVFPNNSLSQSTFSGFGSGNYSQNIDFSAAGDFSVLVSASASGFVPADMLTLNYRANKVINNFTMNKEQLFTNELLIPSTSFCDLGDDPITDVKAWYAILDVNGVVVSNSTVVNANFSAKSCTDVSREIPLSGLAPGTYTLEAGMNFTGDPLSVSRQTFTVSAPSSAGGGFGTVPFISGSAEVPSPEAISRLGVAFTSYPLFRELPMGERSFIDFLISNDAGVARSFSVIVEKIPKEWIEIPAEPVVVQPGGKSRVTLGLSIPKNAPAGNIVGNVRLKSASGEIDSLFMLRLKSYPQDYRFPSFYRSVSLDYTSRETLVTLRMNSHRPFPTVRVVENIPKEIAPHVSSLEFETAPSEILQADPRVSWVLFDTATGEQKEFRYRVNRTVLGLETYANWGIEKVEIIGGPKELQRIALTDIFFPVFTAGESAQVKFSIRNSDVNSHNVRVALSVPAGWRNSPKEVSFTLDPLSVSPVEFRVDVPSKAQPGTYLATIFLIVGNESSEQPLTLIVAGGQTGITGFLTQVAPWLGAIVAAAVLLFIMQQARLVRIGPSEERRKTLSAIKEILKRK
ncbi:hypothetical protein HY546_03440 [archaeon]|nr:hypothetical protein [archaeon]